MTTCRLRSLSNAPDNISMNHARTGACPSTRGRPRGLTTRFNDNASVQNKASVSSFARVLRVCL